MVYGMSMFAQIWKLGGGKGGGGGVDGIVG